MTRGWRLAPRRPLQAVAAGILLLLGELRAQAFMVVLVAVGAGFVVDDFRPGSAWGTGLMVFGGLSLLLRARNKEE